MRKYVHADYEHIVNWFTLRHMPVPAQYELPYVGYIEDGLAAGFLITSDTPTAVLDFFISNPVANKKLRQEAIFQIAKALMEEAKIQKYQRVLCRTKIESIKSAAKDLNFTDLGEFSTYMREI